MLKNEAEIIVLIEQDDWMMGLLKAAESLNLPDWWICAGFVRSKIWDFLHGYEERTPLPDVDVIYFDQENVSEDGEKHFEQQLRDLNPGVPWSVKNQARMHVINDVAPYSSSFEAISKFPETATALGVKLDEEGRVVLAAPYGIDDVVSLIVRPTPCFTETEDLAAIYQERIGKKNWQSRWKNIQVYSIWQ